MTEWISVITGMQKCHAGDRLYKFTWWEAHNWGQVEWKGKCSSQKLLLRRFEHTQLQTRGCHRVFKLLGVLKASCYAACRLCCVLSYMIIWLSLTVYINSIYSRQIPLMPDCMWAEATVSIHNISTCCDGVFVHQTERRGRLFLDLSTLKADDVKFI